MVRPSDVPEVRRPAEPAEEFVRRLAQEKAAAVSCAPDEIVLGADTIVVVREEVFGKPRDAKHARKMLQCLSGRDHWVYTGICLQSVRNKIVDCAATKVSFASLSEAELDEYLETGEPMDKAGAYAIQGLASKFVLEITGSYSNVVGLPVALVYGHLKTMWNIGVAG